MINKKFIIIISFFSVFINLPIKGSELAKSAVPLKDFLILKFDLFIKDNSKNLFRGGGMTGVAYQNLSYNVKIDKKDNIKISIDAIMSKKRYTSKKYFPKLQDCDQVRNKIFLNKYGYSLIRQSFNNLVNTENLSAEIYKKILNISSLDKDSKKKILSKTSIIISIIHPKSTKNFTCSGKLIDAQLQKE